MPGSGTDKTKRWVEEPSPIVILVEPQLGDNIGTCARAMANFGLSELRLVKPRDPWPNDRAYVTASGANRVLDNVKLYDSVKDAIADCTLVLATTARAHDQAKPVVSAEEAARVMQPRIGAGENVAILFGREKWGLENDEVGLADQIVTLPVNPAFASLNLAQAVLILGYEWFKLATENKLPFAMPQRSPGVKKEQLQAFFDNLERELEKVEFFRPAEKKPTMQVNLQNIFHRMAPTQQDIQTLQGVIMAIAHGRKGPARGGSMDGAEAAALRTLLAEHSEGTTRATRAPARGLSRLLRRNPTEAERILWDALTKDRRFAGQGFKRQVPIGPYIADLVSIPLRTVIDVVPADESEEAAKTRAKKREWMAARDYRIVPLTAQDIENDVTSVLAKVEKALAA
ncbi:tRNA (cytidine/uridine-2'-O-)-methyltransferase TrmJ [Variibacter gotjawalensis]|uniref:tRNA (cytidine/uridine-2'-O-)-methyltransferase TrmJ n=1 Tax=Variibacter gotjawalensis TaxID=1333996 RepID=A0A0S3PV17_9BRAD|nr:TrmJ/YjtD family RNA methyltransferase [Variibacter gotjawalensis]NIK50083.1 tRNA/rRNA methyltransferase [Variibacter gotjawalensis]RZS46082.1 tRNA/rRNA methyltransferase [Variibacter gotjawalensis]BAT59757.1 tRNA (cytidine/uridine-2'-O-)-methyltransferase TrmJ [Variibacter gotjawalensis]